ncbi:peptidyl-tRNA hydrolase [Kwoniella pini CBS 10737]|uniref:peptidyl-tRNA hydrolase n=2 Tax=Kwoniella pini CBS 10737 TaxID=1296096 RepID=A0AAJ8L8L1_9TREE
MSSIRMDSIISPIVISIIAFSAGYQLNSYLSSKSNQSLLLSSKNSFSSKKKSESSNNNNNNESESEISNESEGGTDTESDLEDTKAALSSNLNLTKFNNKEEMKLILIINDELKMTKGKIAAQAGHATLACALTLKEANPKLFRAWQNQGQPKIALRCANTEELEILAAQARSLNLCARTIRDAGRTQVAPGSKTVVGIGPGPARLINTVTGKLKLL